MNAYEEVLLSDLLSGTREISDEDKKELARIKLNQDVDHEFRFGMIRFYECMLYGRAG